MKPLDEMTTEELGRLFPVIITDYNAAWPQCFLDEKRRILKALEGFPVHRIDHVGSTAIPGLASKPVIDMILQLNGEIEECKLIETFKGLDYHFNRRNDNPPPHMTFVKGYTPEGYEELCFHIHVRYKGPCREIVFKEFLIHHPQYAREYEELKKKLARKHKYNREHYTLAKTAFIELAMDKALKDIQ